VHNTPPYRVVQWTTGNVGKSSVQAITANPTLELVGCYAWSPEKIGRDVGELCGMDPLGVLATNDVDALLALKPDCVVYNPMWLDVGELVRILSAGVNVVATAAFITGHNLGEGRDRIIEACRLGGSTMFGTGISPGFAELLAIVSATICDRVDKITINEAADTTFYDSPATEIPVGFGKPIDHPDLQTMTAEGTAVFGRPCGWWPTRWGSNSMRFVAKPSTPRPLPISTWGRGPLGPDVWRGWPPVGRGYSVTGWLWS
jgi:2,4-diaminopentanoate dehydrogenase